MRTDLNVLTTLLAAGLLVATSASLAQTPAAAPTTTTPAEATPMGRLFFSPVERVDLERRRFAPAPAPVVPVAPKVAAPAPVVEPPPPQQVTINGHVLRSSGRSTTWVNGTPKHDNYRTNAESLRVPSSERGPRVALRVGETYDEADRKRRDVIGNGTVRVLR